jgi:ribosomal protein S12 methylthiotransferase accessory factor
MDLIIDFPGGAKVDAHFGSFTVETDQSPRDGGEGSAPMPFDLFLSSIGTCAGIYVLGFCRKRNLPTDGIRIVERVHPDPATGMVEKIDLEIQVPPSFPKEYYDALVRSASLCKVKKTLEQPPQFEIVTREVELG